MSADGTDEADGRLFFQNVRLFPGWLWLDMTPAQREAEKKQLRREIEDRLAGDGFLAEGDVPVRIEVDEMRREVWIRASVTGVPM